MDTREFEAQLHRDGHLDVKTRLLDPAVETHPYSHPFDTRLLVLEGEVTIRCCDMQQTYRAGDVFEIDAGVEHSEHCTATRFGFVVGLRHTLTGQ